MPEIFSFIVHDPVVMDHIYGLHHLVSLLIFLKAGLLYEGHWHHIVLLHMSY